MPRYNEALDRMVGDLYYLYHADDRYYFHAEENLNKVASDRKDALDSGLVDEKIIAELKGAVGRRSDVIVCPPEFGVRTGFRRGEAGCSNAGPIAEQPDQ